MDSDFLKSLKILNLAENADLDEIKSAYRKLVKIHHPDLYKNPENKEKAANNFKIITKAFDYLKDNYVPPSQRRFEKPKEEKTYTRAKKSNNFNSYAKDSNDWLIQLLNKCIREKQKIKITYQTSYYGKNITQRVILPLELYLGQELNNIFKNSRYKYERDKIYLIAYCELRRDKRTFRLDRIINIQTYTGSNNENQSNYTYNNQETNAQNSTVKQEAYSNNEELKANLGCIIYVIIIILVSIFCHS